MLLQGLTITKIIGNKTANLSKPFSQKYQRTLLKYLMPRVLEGYGGIIKNLILVMCSVSTNGERVSLANLKLTIGSLLECSLSVKSFVDRLA